MSKVTVDTIAALRQIPYFKALAEADQRQLAAVCAVRSLVKSERAFEEGHDPAGVYLILAGRMHLVRTAASGREQLLHEEGPGATLGEVPVFDGEGYVGSAIAADATLLLFIPRRPLLESIGRAPASAAAVIRVLARRVRKFAALVEDLSLRSVPERTARYLLLESNRAGGSEVMLADTRDVLAARLGTVREEVSRTLSRFKRDGIIDMHGRRIRILDEGRLRALADDGP